MTKNTSSTRYYSEKQEAKVASIVNGLVQSNSGAGKFNKGDIINCGASLLIECKTSTTEKDSFSIKKEWLTKNLQEAKQLRLSNSCLAFNFGPDTPNYFVIDEKLMKYLVEKMGENS